MAGPELQGTVEAIRVPERGTVEVSPEDWVALSRDDRFWRLVDRNIVRVSMPQPGRTILHGTCYVGRAACGGRILEFCEKIDGALAALIRFASYDSFKVMTAEAPSSDLGDLAVLLVRAFLESTRRYVSQGREFKYARVGAVGSLVGGRLDITRTVALRARGLRHRIAFDRDVLSRRTNVNRIVLAALREVNSLAGDIPLTTGDIADSRSLALLFSDCAPDLAARGRSSLLDEAQRSMREPGGRHRDLLALASVLLAHESFERADVIAGIAPRSWFLNLETLFEEAIRAVLRDLLAPVMTVSRGLERAIFDKWKGEFKGADLLCSRSGAIEATGDVKYKEWSGAASAPDLYQLLVHASANQSETAFLVFPDDSFSHRSLGHAVTGAGTHLFAVDVRALDVDLKSVVERLGILGGDASELAAAASS